MNALTNTSLPHPTAQSRRERWIGILAALVYPQDSPKAADAMGKFLSMLQDVPDEAFTQRSAEHVASLPRRMAIPSYDEVGKGLRLWWRENRSGLLAISHEKPLGWNETDQVWLDYWHRRVAQRFAMAPNMTRIPGGLTVEEHCASLVRTYSARAWQVITEGRRA